MERDQEAILKNVCYALVRIANALDLQNKLAEETLREVQRQANPMHVYDPFNPE